MSRIYRLSLMGLSLLVLLIVGWVIEGSFDFLLNDFWFAAGFLLLITLSLVDQPHFSKDSNIFVNAITAGMSLLLVPDSERDITYWIFLGVIAYLLASSYVLMFLRNRNLGSESKPIQVLSRINRQLGQPTVIFSALFLWGAIRQFTMMSEQFNALLVFWIVFMVLNVPAVAKTIESLFDKESYEKHDEVIGSIIASKSGNLYSMALKKGNKVHLGEGVLFCDGAIEDVHHGIVVSTSQLSDSVWADIMCFSADNTQQNMTFKLKPNLVYKSDSLFEYNNRYVGTVAAGTSVNLLRFEYKDFVPLQVGELLEVETNDKKIVYQVTDACIREESLQGDNEQRMTLGEAVQLGVWNAEEGRFDLYGWTPNCSSAVLVAANPEEETKVSEGEIVIGAVPGSDFPVIMDKESAITHHLAILGVTGTGKSHFARNLIRSIADKEQKIIVVDLTGEYEKMFPGIKKIVDADNSEKAFNAIETIAKQNAEFANKRDQGKIKTSEETLKTVFYNSIKGFLEGDDTTALFELPDITNRSSIFEYVRWFFWCLFETSKTKANFGKRVCVVLEEAHTVVPEYNSMGANDSASKASVNSIAQIALQGRKYNIGLIVIAQRTANVSKTILTQCNSIVAFQEFDKTSTDFLSSYMSPSHLKALSTLKFRTGIAVGKAFKSTVPMLFEVPYIKEEPQCPAEIEDKEDEFIF